MVIRARLSMLGISTRGRATPRSSPTWAAASEGDRPACCRRLGRSRVARLLPTLESTRPAVTGRARARMEPGHQGRPSLRPVGLPAPATPLQAPHIRSTASPSTTSPAASPSTDASARPWAAAAGSAARRARRTTRSTADAESTVCSASREAAGIPMRRVLSKTALAPAARQARGRAGAMMRRRGAARGSPPILETSHGAVHASSAATAVLATASSPKPCSATWRAARAPWGVSGACSAISLAMA